ncbi:hypothetical protein EVAR_68396_1 [Eumeta japonica]|uniref:Uncharacterized protein n=1 Tax=Eumeta variegata TaxID=151549 RepID=A0A4C2A9S9_EUMVA|nr:hypothetical protein EVAR_68396_1 [Eumeta japonica]
MEWNRDRCVTRRTLRPVVPLRSALLLAGLTKGERDNESRFFVRAAGIYRFIIRYHVKSLSLKLLPNLRSDYDGYLQKNVTLKRPRRTWSAPAPSNPIKSAAAGAGDKSRRVAGDGLIRYVPVTEYMGESRNIAAAALPLIVRTRQGAPASTATSAGAPPSAGRRVDDFANKIVKFRNGKWLVASRTLYY